MNTQDPQDNDNKLNETNSSSKTPSEKEKTVMTFGTFDYFHEGHQEYLKQAKNHGQKLVTVIARDNTVKKVKGDYPDKDEEERQDIVFDSGIADEVILGDLKDKYNVIREHKPDVICLGYDQFAFTQQLQKLIIQEKLNTEIVRLEAHNPKENKSSIIKNQQQSLL